MQRRNFLAAGIVMGIASLAGSGLNAQEKKTKTVNGGGLTFEAPVSWKSAKPSGTMRRAQLAIPAAGGDKEDGECVLFAFPGGAGPVDANIERWAGQFRTEAGAPPKPEVTKAKGKNTEVIVVNLAGRYVAPIAPGNAETVDKPGFMLVGAIVMTPEISYFLKVTGPEKTMKAAKAELDALIASMNLEQ